MFDPNSVLRLDDILGSERDPEAVARDNVEQVESLARDTPEDQRALEIMKLAQTRVRQVSYRLLGKLDDLGIEGAIPIAEKLRAIDPEETPLEADLSAVAFAYDEEREQTDDPEELARLKYLGSLADATFGVATFLAVRLGVPEDSPHGAELGQFAAERIDEAAIPRHTKYALSTILDKVQATVKPPQQ